jgi:bifunctional enzyme CysN/CysC
MDETLIESDIEAYLAQHKSKELLRFLTCGSVDDGKSTLIGRLLHDTQMIYEDQLAAVVKDSARVGTTGDAPDLALLVDGLKAEREQGITIDVAYRYFSTEKRKFIIADCPGHEQYTRNMATGASTCDLAIILIDARKGVSPQTCRHSFIVSLLGIKHVIVLVNKMDLVGYARERYDEIVAQFREFVAKLEVHDVRAIPCSALKGDNVVVRSAQMPWYDGPTLMWLLDNIHIASDQNLIDFRFPVQHVMRPHQDFRGFAGTIASGSVKIGDEVMVLPSKKTSTVRSIVTYGGNLERAFAPQAVTLTLKDEIDVSRGDMLVHPTNRPRVAHELEAMLVWMAETPLEIGREYVLKHTARTTSARVTTVRYAVDVNTLAAQPQTTLALNQIGRVALVCARPLFWDAYRNNRETGAFIVVDRMTNATVAAGMLVERDTATRDGLAPPSSPVTLEERAAFYGHRPATVLLMGRTAPQVALQLERKLFEARKHVVVWDGIVDLSAAVELTRRAGIILLAPVDSRDGSVVADLLFDADRTSADACADAVLDLLVRTTANA